ncbi:hypothetical protein M3Y97_01010600 [Aphelenchoides bicaudatus]|nr:hypothetical protein M3Y97_01010600 [Aphelenchoides bicaudatus]
MDGMKKYVQKRVSRPYPFTALKAIGPQLAINSVGSAASQRPMARKVSGGAASQRPMARKVSGPPASQQPMAKKVCPSTSSQDDQDDEVSFGHLLALAKNKLDEEEDPNLLCASCRVEVDKPQIVGVVLEEMIEIHENPDNDEIEIGDIWFCRSCFEHYVAKIVPPFSSFQSGEWTGKGKPTKGPDVNCVLETVITVKIRRINELRIIYNDVEYLLFDCGDPLVNEETEME